MRLVRRPAAACGPWAPCSAARIPSGVALLCYARSMLLLPWLARMCFSAAELAPVLGPVAGQRRRSVQVRGCSLCPAAFGRRPSMGQWMLASGSGFSSSVSLDIVREQRSKLSTNSSKYAKFKNEIGTSEKEEAASTETKATPCGPICSSLHTMGGSPRLVHLASVP